MLRKLKRFIFDESDELKSEKPTATSVTPRSLSDSLEDNKNLRRARPMKERHEDLFKKNAPLTPKESSTFKPIDIDLPPSFSLADEHTNTKKTVVKAVSKPLVKPVVPKKQSTPDPKYFQPRSIISPIFGTNQVSPTEDVVEKPFVKKHDSVSKILSPVSGQVDLSKAIKPKESDRIVDNISLEDMLNAQTKTSDLDYTLFDVPIDHDEFISRENIIVKDIRNRSK